MQSESGKLLIGWSERDVTPDKPVFLAGGGINYSRGVMDPLSVTAMAISSENASDTAVFVSCDRVSIPEEILLRCRQKIKENLPQIDTDKIILNATHTHSAPHIEKKSVLPDIPEGAMSPDEYAGIFIAGVSNAVCRAWENRRPSGFSYGLGFAVVGHNRRVAYSNGTRKMYGMTDDPLFSHIEGYEDHGVDLFFTFDESDNLTGVVINLACPAQETEGISYVSADFWHEVREEVRSKFGKDLFILPQCAPAGDQSPHRLVYKQYGQSNRHEPVDRMLKLKGITMRREIGRRVASALGDVLPHIKQDIRREVILRHVVKTIELPGWMVPEDVYRNAKSSCEEIEKTEPVFAKDEKRKSGEINRCRALMKRYEEQESAAMLPMELHVIRLGDIVFATNSFELFLDYGIQIKARSSADQTFLIQLCPRGYFGGYLPSARAVNGWLGEKGDIPVDDGSPGGGARGYGAGILTSSVGPAGGRVIVEETLKAVRGLWSE